MSRPKQTGFEYFPFESSFFEDIKVRKLIKFGFADAIPVYISALCFIFKDGYYVKMDEDFPFFIYEKTGIDESRIAECLAKCADVGLFDKHLYEQGILTSVGIQKRYRKICSQSRRITTIGEFNLLEETQETKDSFGGNLFNDEVSAEETPSTTDSCNISDEEMPQSKGKEKEIKDTPPISNEIVPPLNDVESITTGETALTTQTGKTIEERQHAFGLSLIPYVERYGKEMIREFFDYWTEHNENGRKMRFEMQKVFNIPRRLVTWSKNNERFGTRGGTKRGSTISEAIQVTVLPENESLTPTIDITKLLK